jgi:hypothetical protein
VAGEPAQELAADDVPVDIQYIILPTCFWIATFNRLLTMANPESSDSPQAKLFHECGWEFHKGDPALVEKTLHKDFRHPLLVLRPPPSKLFPRSDWLDRFSPPLPPPRENRTWGCWFACWVWQRLPRCEAFHHGLSPVDKNPDSLSPRWRINEIGNDMAASSPFPPLLPSARLPTPPTLLPPFLCSSPLKIGLAFGWTCLSILVRCRRHVFCGPSPRGVSSSLCCAPLASRRASFGVFPNFSWDSLGLCGHFICDVARCFLCFAQSCLFG